MKLLYIVVTVNLVYFWETFLPLAKRNDKISTQEYLHVLIYEIIFKVRTADLLSKHLRILLDKQIMLVFLCCIYIILSQCDKERKN